MRNLILALLIIVTVFLFSTSVLAKSGCCSSHGGVNCGAGAQGDGRVICNDGWTGSSCLYSEMVMCGGSSSNSTNYNPPAYPSAATNTPLPLPTSTPYIPPSTATPIPPTLTPIPPTQTPISTNTPEATSEVLGAQAENPTPTIAVQSTTGSSAVGNILTLLLLGGGGWYLLKRRQQKQPPTQNLQS